MVLCELLLFCDLDLKKDLPGTVGRNKPEKKPYGIHSTLVIVFDHEKHLQSPPGLSIRLQVSTQMGKNVAFQLQGKQVTLLGEHQELLCGLSLLALRCSEMPGRLQVLTPSGNRPVTTGSVDLILLASAAQAKGDGLLVAKDQFRHTEEPHWRNPPYSLDLSTNETVLSSTFKKAVYLK